jgi:hypothetical protein
MPHPAAVPPISGSGYSAAIGKRWAVGGILLLVAVVSIVPVLSCVVVPDDAGQISAAGGTDHDERADRDPTTSAPPVTPGVDTAAMSTPTSAPAPTTVPPAGDPYPPAGNTDRAVAVPGEAQAVDTSQPDHVIGDGTPASCTSAAVVDTVAQGGVITFNCGPDPVTITMEATAKVDADTVIDGGGTVVLSGAGQRRILSMNAGWKAAGPRLTVQNLTFVDGNSTGDHPDPGDGGGGAIFTVGGRLKVVGSRFFRNRCDPTGPDLGGAGIRVVGQPDGQPAYVVNSTFGGSPELANECSNGGAISGLHASIAVYNTLISHNSAIGNGANPARDGTPGGGSGGAIYTDGNNFTVMIAGSVIEANHANEGGGAVFFVSNDRTGIMSIVSSRLHGNPSDGFETEGFPGIFFLGAHDPELLASTLD